MKCKNFKTGSEKPYSDVIDFELKIPIYVGPLRVNKNSLTIGSTNNAASLEVYSKKYNSPTLIVKDGKVGIGTDAPLGNLSLVNKEANSVSLLFRSKAGGEYITDDDYKAARIQAGWENVESAWDQGFLKFDNVRNNNGDYQNTMTLKGGKVGIGTEEPAVTLDVRGNLEVTGFSTAGGLIVKGASELKDKLTITSGGLDIEQGETTLSEMLRILDGGLVLGNINDKPAWIANKGNTDDKIVEVSFGTTFYGPLNNIVTDTCPSKYKFRIGHYREAIGISKTFQTKFSVDREGNVKTVGTLNAKTFKIGETEIKEDDLKALVKMARKLKS